MSIQGMKVRAVVPTADNSTNFNIAHESETVVGTTLDNLKAAVTGETGASAKYKAFAKIAREAGYDQIAMETKLIQKVEPDFVRPEAPEMSGVETDLNLIAGALGEMYETSDMYPAFIAKAIEEGETEAVQAFTRAKLAEAVHAELYLDAYNNIDAPDDQAYYLCPVCGYIHKGDDFEKCPICFAQKSAFKKF